LEGLEISEIRLSAIAVSDTGHRLDSEFYRQAILQAKRKIDSCLNTKPIGEITALIQHPVEISREYSDQGYRVLLAQEVRSNTLSLGAGSYMDNPGEQFLYANRLQRGDVVLTRSGANFGQCAPILLDDEIYACADLLVIRKGSLPAGYVSTVLNTSYVRLLLDRGAYGMAQPHIAPTYVRKIHIPIFPLLIESVSRLLDLAGSAKQDADALLKEAEAKLLHALNLDSWQALEPLTYLSKVTSAIKSFKDSFASTGRLDAEYYQPKYDNLLTLLRKDNLTIRDVAPLRNEGFRKPDGGDFQYIEIGGLRGDGTVLSETVACEAAPSRASQRVRNGDIITSTVRPIRRLTALVSAKQDGYVCSSGFVVLQPKKIAAEALLVYLRLPAICELMDLHTSASLYPAISEKDLLGLPIPNIPATVQANIATLVQQSFTLKAQSERLLEAAKRAVEIAIEQDEAAGMAYLARETSIHSESVQS